MSKYVSYCDEVLKDFDLILGVTDKVTRLKLKTYTKQQQQEFETYRELSKRIKASVMFKMPSNGMLFEAKKDSLSQEVKDRLSKFVEMAKLPYQHICLTFDAEVPMEKHGDEMAKIPLVVSAYETQEFIEILIAVKHNKSWVTPKTDKLFINKTDFNTVVWSPFNDEFSEYLHGVAAVSVAHLIAALSCSNATIEDDESQPSLLKQKMLKDKGKKPLFTYKVLTINTKGNAVNLNDQGAGPGAKGTVRSHLRRGHIRHLKTKNVWVNACVVGNKTNGEISKDYRVI